MKKRKRGALVLLAVLVALSTTAVAFAEPALGVWIDYSTFSNADGSLLVPIFTDGTATDGIVTLTYNPEVLSVTPEDLEVTELTVMHAASLVKPGELKISWIADTTEGTLMFVHFTVKKISVDTGLRLTGQAFVAGREDNVSVAVGSLGAILPELPPPAGVTTPGGAAAPGGAATPSGSDSMNVPRTGDGFQPLLCLIAAAASAAGAAVCLRKIRKGAK